MPTWKTIAFTMLELKGLWCLATDTPITDPLLAAAGEAALDKVYRTERGMPRRGHAPGHHRGPDLNLREQT